MPNCVVKGCRNNSSNNKKKDGITFHTLEHNIAPLWQYNYPHLLELSVSAWRTNKRSYYVRCTRRFTPGFCPVPVAPVWTFVFQLQNCTERLGCPAMTRTNRFVSYISCIRRCRGLVDLYTDILAHDARNLTAYMRSKSWGNSRREMEYDEPDIDRHVQDEIAEDVARQPIEGPRPWAVDDDDSGAVIDIDAVHDEDDDADDFMEGNTTIVYKL